MRNFVVVLQFFDNLNKKIDNRPGKVNKMYVCKIF